MLDTMASNTIIKEMIMVVELLRALEPPLLPHLYTFGCELDIFVDD